MTKNQLETAMKEGIPFLIRMADGENYGVRDGNRIALGTKAVILVGNDDMPRILPS